MLSLSLYLYLTFFTIDDTDQRIKTILASTQAGKVEGVITNFNRTIEHKRYTNVTSESFQVDAVTFQYNDYLLGRFNTFSKTYNNVLRDGLKVRITYRIEDNDIQQIEIAEEL